MKWTKRHTDNPVSIQQRAGWHVKNECDDVLFSGKTRAEALEWCKKNFCRPIEKSWKQFNREGY